MKFPANYNDLTDKKFGKLSVLYRTGTAKNRTPLWYCKCDCGNYRTVRANHLMHNHTTSCGCYQKKRVSQTASFDLTGQKFNRIKVLGESSRRIQRAKVWLCECDCGNTAEIRSTDLVGGHSKSCGCYRLDKIRTDNPTDKSYCSEWDFKEFKDLIKYRDRFVCLNPDCWGTAGRLAIHHIDYNKKNCELRNLITICTSCNSRANTDREWYTSWYQAILSRRYNYKY